MCFPLDSVVGVRLRPSTVCSLQTPVPPRMSPSLPFFGWPQSILILGNTNWKLWRTLSSYQRNSFVFYGHHWITVVIRTHIHTHTHTDAHRYSEGLNALQRPISHSSELRARNEAGREEINSIKATKAKRLKKQQLKQASSFLFFFWYWKEEEEMAISHKKGRGERNKEVKPQFS